MKVGALFLPHHLTLAPLPFRLAFLRPDSARHTTTPLPCLVQPFTDPFSKSLWTEP